MPPTMTTPALLQTRDTPVHPCSPDLGALNARLEDTHPLTVIRRDASGRTECGLHL